MSRNDKAPTRRAKPVQIREVDPVFDDQEVWEPTGSLAGNLCPGDDARSVSQASRNGKRKVRAELDQRQVHQEPEEDQDLCGPQLRTE